MEKKSLFFAAVMVLAAVFGSLTGCKPGGDKKSVVELTVVSPFTEDDGNRVNFVNAYTAYEEASGNTVTDVPGYSNEEWKAQILSDFQNGNEPDILFYFTGADADELVKSGKLVPIGDIRRVYPDYASNMKDSMMPVSTYNGRQYAVPVNGYWEGLFVNLAVLEACGVDVPDADYTWEQFLEDCRVIKDRGYVPIAASLADVPHYWFEFCTFNNGTISSHVTIPQNSGDKAGVIWAAGLLDIKELYDSGFFPENTLTATDGETNLLMTENKAAFMIDGSWKVGWFQINAEDINNFTVTYVPAKGERIATDIIGGLSMGYYITKKVWDDPAKREACVNFILAMTTDEVVSSFGSLSVTALKNGTTPIQDADSLETAALEMTKGCTAVVSAAQDALSLTARSSLFGDVAGIVAGSITPEEAIDKCLSIEK